MQYLALIYGNETEDAAIPETEMAGLMQEFGQFTQDIKTSGNWVGGSQLYPVSRATTIRLRDGKRSITDGPFAQTKEQLGGYYVIEANDLDQAIDIASRIPSARYGSIELRPIVPPRI